MNPTRVEKLPSMTPEERKAWVVPEAMKVLAECRKTGLPAGWTTDREDRLYARTVDGRILTSLDALLELVVSESEAYQRGFEAARERAAGVASGLRMIAPSPIGPLHGAGWNDVVARIEPAIRALRPDPPAPPSPPARAFPIADVTRPGLYFARDRASDARARTWTVVRVEPFPAGAVVGAWRVVGLGSHETWSVSDLPGWELVGPLKEPIS